MRTNLIVFLPPCLDQPFCSEQGSEPVGIQALGSEVSVERFNEGVASRRAKDLSLLTV